MPGCAMEVVREMSGIDRGQETAAKYPAGDFSALDAAATDASASKQRAMPTIAAELPTDHSGLTTTTRMAARPSNDLQQKHRCTFVSELRSVYALRRGLLGKRIGRAAPAHNRDGMAACLYGRECACQLLWPGQPR